MNADEVLYRLDEPRGARTPGTLWDAYQGTLETARSIVNRSKTTKGALASACKLCHWYSSCTGAMRAADDLTLIPMLGRAIRDAMEPDLPTVQALQVRSGFVSGGVASTNLPF